MRPFTHLSDISSYSENIHQILRNIGAGRYVWPISDELLLLNICITLRAHLFFLTFEEFHKIVFTPEDYHKIIGSTPEKA